MSAYLAVIEHAGDSWGAYCPDLPGVGAVGATREEVERLVGEAIALHLEGLLGAGEPLPDPAAVAGAIIENTHVAD
jgi:predicted RNase H-like HicB family nuclease